MSARSKVPNGPRLLFYRAVPHNGGLVFAEPERAEHIASIHSAIERSKTWSDFAGAMPEGELQRILKIAFDEQGEDRPDNADEFDADVIPGWSDGDFPAWLQAEQHRVLPEQVLTTFAVRIQTSLGNSCWDISEDKTQQICEALRAVGIATERRQDLSFH